jgi:hypothetical protein
LPAFFRDQMAQLIHHDAAFVPAPAHRLFI